MEPSSYKVRSVAQASGVVCCVDLDLEFEDGRAYIIIDSVPVGRYRFKTRLEIDPKLLARIRRAPFDFAYRGTLVLPRPQDN